MESGASSYRRFREGDTSAFDHIVKEYFDPLVFFLYRYVSDYATSEDIAMDVFAYVWAYPRHYNGKVSFKTYLFMLGRSRALDYIKHRNKLTMIPLQDLGEQASNQPQTEIIRSIVEWAKEHFAEIPPQTLTASAWAMM